MSHIDESCHTHINRSCHSIKKNRGCEWCRASDEPTVGSFFDGRYVSGLHMASICWREGGGRGNKRKGGERGGGGGTKSAHLLLLPPPSSSSSSSYSFSLSAPHGFARVHVCLCVYAYTQRYAWIHANNPVWGGGQWVSDVGIYSQ